MPAKKASKKGAKANPHGIKTTPGPVPGWESESLKNAKKNDSKTSKPMKVGGKKTP
jgi:hypothetical protein